MSKNNTVTTATKYTTTNLTTITTTTTIYCGNHYLPNELQETSSHVSIHISCYGCGV